MTEAIYQKRRQRVFFVLSGRFLGTLAMLNILGVTRFLDFSFTLFGLQIPMIVAVGVLPYPVTFMCTDLISELFGEEKARDMVLVGLLLNVWVVFLLWLGSVLPGAGVDPATGAPLIDAAGRKPVFFEVKDAAFGAVAASMVAYLVAQFCDVRIFHWMKRLTKGRHLWLRNNVSTMFSQLVDSTAVILVTYIAAASFLPLNDSEPVWPQLLALIASGYVFKLVVAALGTGPIYLAVRYLRVYLGLGDNEEATNL